MRAVLLVLGLVIFVFGIGWWAFAITAGLADLPASGSGAIAAIVIGAGLLIGVFLMLAHRQRRSDRDPPS